MQQASPRMSYRYLRRGNFIQSVLLLSLRLAFVRCAHHTQPTQCRCVASKASETLACERREATAIGPAVRNCSRCFLMYGAGGRSALSFHLFAAIGDISCIRTLTLNLRSVTSRISQPINFSLSYALLISLSFRNAPKSRALLAASALS